MSTKVTVALCVASLLGISSSASAQHKSHHEVGGEVPHLMQNMALGEPATPFADLVAQGLGRHPAVQQRRAEIDVERQRKSGVGLPPDPSISLGAESFEWSDPGLSSNPMSGIQLMITQPLWWPGELRALKKEVDARVSALEPLVDEQEVDLVIDAAGLYYDIYRIDRTVEALEATKAPLNEFRDLLTRRIPTGKATIAQVERVRLQLLRIDDRILMLRHTRTEKIALLNARLNRPAGSPVNPPLNPPEGSFDAQTAHALVSLPELVDRAMKQRPMVEALERQKRVAHARADAADWQRYPDLKVFGGWRFRVAQDSGMDDGTDFVGLGVQSTLPIWSGDKAAAAKDVAQAQVIALDSAIANFRLTLRGQIAEQLATLHHFLRHASYYRETLIPQAEQARKAALAGFRAGQANYEDWIEAQQRIVDLRATLAGYDAGIKRQRAIILALVGDAPTASSHISDSREATSHSMEKK